MHRQILNRLLDVPHIGEIEPEGLRREAILLVCPQNSCAVLLKGLAETADGSEQRPHGH
jgi:hypothetical protein